MGGRVGHVSGDDKGRETEEMDLKKMGIMKQTTKSGRRDMSGISTFPVLAL